MNHNFDITDELESELDYDTTYDSERDELESDDAAFGGSLAFCSPAFREIFG